MQPVPPPVLLVRYDLDPPTCAGGGLPAQPIPPGLVDKPGALRAWFEALLCFLPAPPANDAGDRQAIAS